MSAYETIAHGPVDEVFERYTKGMPAGHQRTEVAAAYSYFVSHSKAVVSEKFKSSYPTHGSYPTHVRQMTVLAPMILAITAKSEVAPVQYHFTTQADSSITANAELSRRSSS